MKFNGSDTDTLSAQVICYDFQVNGSGASFLSTTTRTTCST